MHFPKIAWLWACYGIICRLSQLLVLGCITLFFTSMVYFLLSLNMIRKKAFSVSKYDKNMLARRKRITCCFMQQNAALHEHESKFCSIEIFNELTCQKHMMRFERCIFPQKY